MILTRPDRGTWSLRLGTGEMLQDLSFALTEEGGRSEICRPARLPDSGSFTAAFNTRGLSGELRARRVSAEIVSIRSILMNNSGTERRITSVTPFEYFGTENADGVLTVSKRAVLYTTPAERNYGFDGARALTRNDPLTSFWFFSLHDPDGRMNLLVGVEEVPDAFISFQIHPVLSEKQGKRVLRLRCECDCRSGARGVRLLPGATFSPVSLCILRWKGDHEEGRRRFGDYLGARFSRVTESAPPAGWCSWYAGYGTEIDQAACLLNLDAARAIPSLRVFQVDDGWMGDPVATPKGMPLVKTNHFPAGMKRLAQRIAEAGLIPGIWIRPFRGFGDKSGFPSWAKGACLDLSHPAALQWIESYTRCIAREWGYRYIKSDFMTYDFTGRWGMEFEAYPAASFTPSDDTVTNARIYRRGLEAIRRGAGEDCFLLGCNCLTAPAFGILDAFRTGDDVSAWNWDRTVMMGAGSIPVYAFLNRRLWWNDPDCLLFHEPLDLMRTRLWNICAVLSGGMKIVSSKLHELIPERLELVRSLLQIEVEESRVIRVSGDGLPELILGRGRTGSSMTAFLAVCNWRDARTRIRIPAQLPTIRPTGIRWFDYFDGSEYRFQAPAQRKVRLEPYGVLFLAAEESA